MAKSTATSRTGDLKALLALLRESGVRRYKSADLELELDPPAAAAYGDAVRRLLDEGEGDDLPDDLKPRRRGKKGKAAAPAPRRQKTVMDDPDLYPDGQVPDLEELDS